MNWLLCPCYASFIALVPKERTQAPGTHQLSLPNGSYVQERSVFISQVCCCCCSVPKSYLTLGNSMDCSTPGILTLTISQSSSELISIELVMSSNQLILCRPLLLLPSIFPSIRVFSNDAVCVRWP